MDWIKRNYDQFILALVALILLVLSGFLISSAIGFQDIFAGIRGQVVHRNEIPPVDINGVQQAADSVQNPGKWELKDEHGSLFVSIPYIAIGGTLVDIRTNGVRLHPPIPNNWFITNKLDILDNNILNEDLDGTGFTVLDDWKNIKGDGSDALNPWDKNAHPPYYTKLRLVRYIKQPFRLLFNAYDGEIKNPDSLQFQINTIDVTQPTQFVKIGDVIAGTKFKVIKFEFKSVPNASTGIDRDVSELTVQNTETGDNVVLVLEEVANSPDSYALFRYLWNNTQFEVKKNKEFVLLPETNLRYKLIDIQEDQALIQTPAGQPVKVPRLDKQP